jgi:hypothetical protein
MGNSVAVHVITEVASEIVATLLTAMILKKVA